MPVTTKKPNTTSFSVRMDKDIKSQCEAIYGELMFFCASHCVPADFHLMYASKNQIRKPSPQ